MINRIHQGNGFELMQQLSDSSIDLIFTDPPYISSLADMHSNLDGSRIDFFAYTREFDRLLKPTGQLAIFADMKTAVILFQAFQDFFRFRFNWLWIKPHGQPVSTGKQPRNNTELILVFCKKSALTGTLTFNPVYDKGQPYSKKTSGSNQTRKGEFSYMTVSNGERFPAQTLYFPAKDNLPAAERTQHPTQKPLALCGNIISTLSNPGDLVLDPFSGSGSIAIAARKYNRRFIAAEIDPGYFAESAARLSRELSQGVLF